MTAATAAAIYGGIESQVYANVASNAGPFTLRGGQYAVTIIATAWGTVALQRQAADGSTFVSVPGAAFASNGFVAVDLPSGTYQFLVAGASGVYVDITSVIVSGL